MMVPIAHEVLTHLKRRSHIAATEPGDDTEPPTDSDQTGTQTDSHQRTDPGEKMASFTRSFTTGTHCRGLNVMWVPYAHRLSGNDNWNLPLAYTLGRLNGRG